MTTAIIFHEVKNAAIWTKAWRKGPGSRHEMFGKIGAKARTFQDLKNPNMTGVFVEISDMAVFDKLMSSAEGKKAMEEDGLKVETMRVLTEVTP
ncbi:MAG TPA: hypothetical protein VGM64_08000 [Lacunisphaera sp.]|jgi:hypothetical protein